MKRLIAGAAMLSALSMPALAADLPNIKGPPVFAPPPPVFTWSGLYVGGQIGYQWGRDAWGAFIPGGAASITEPSYSDGGIVGGGHIGYNYQISQFVLGVEGDVEGTSNSGSGLAIGAPVVDTSRINIEGSIRARAGLAWDRVLIYATGGAAFAEFHNNLQAPAVGVSAGASTGRVGWTVGAGVEYAIDPHWSIRAEYRYTDYGGYNWTNPIFAPLNLHQHETDNRAEAGFSYKFDMFAPPAPIVAKY